MYNMYNDLVKNKLNYWLGKSKKDELYLVGGTVRDLIMKVNPKDLDLTCKNACSFAKRLADKKNAALVAMEKKKDEPCYRVVNRDDPLNFLDIAELRGETIEKDLRKREFTINSKELFDIFSYSELSLSQMIFLARLFSSFASKILFFA
ncbi:hypothetical protein GMMP15_1330011 [Candidatus Magnetomoraceae bacterium gMMP-15]